jgi:hypothetical protein
VMAITASLRVICNGVGEVDAPQTSAL